MKLAIFNGSPRKTKSNSTLLINHFLKGYHDNTTSDPIIHYLASTSKNTEHVQTFEDADTVIIIFPLYTDAMPGQVKFFIESIGKSNSAGKTVGFIVQSGFPEAHHSIFVERYLQKLALRMNWNYLGTIIKGGVEGIQIMPPMMTKKLFLNFEKLGRYFATTSEFDPTIVKKLRKPYRISAVAMIFMKLTTAMGLHDFYWNMKLKEHNAYDRRFAKPYAPK